MNVYRLRSDPDRPWLQAVERGDQATLGELWHADQGVGKGWKVLRVERIAGEDPEVMGGVPGGPLTDFPTLGGASACFSRRAVDALLPFLVRNGEVLPLACDEGEFFVYHVTTRVRALDEERSKVARIPPSGRVAMISHYELLAEALDDLTIFQLTKEQGGVLLVTDTFVDRVRASVLTGFVFERVWPLAEEGSPSPQRQGTPSLPQLDVTERSLASAEHAEIEEAAAAAIELTHTDGVPSSSADVLDVIDRRLKEWKASTDVDDFAITLGCCWGEQLRRALGWEWVYLEARVKRKTVGEGFALVPPDRSFAVLPMVTLRKQLQRPPGQRSMSLLFQMLVSGRGFNTRGPGSYTIVG